MIKNKYFRMGVLMKKLIIIPAYNEEENIERTIKMIEKGTNDFDYEIINDCSKDNTKKICEENHFNYVDLPINLGIGGAVQTGYKYALINGYDLAVQVDGDGQHDIHSLPNLVEPILNDEADFTVGSRFLDESNSEFKSSK